MPNMNSYTYMHNHKGPNDKPNEIPNSCQTKCVIYQANIDSDIAGYKQKCYLGSCETIFKDRFGNHKKSFNHLNHENDRNYQKNFGKSKSAMEHQKLLGKLSECVPLTT